MDTQVRELQAQVLAFKHLLRGLPVPPEAAAHFRGVPPPPTGYVPSPAVAALHARVRKQVANEMVLMTSLATATDVAAYRRPMVVRPRGSATLRVLHEVRRRFHAGTTAMAHVRGMLGVTSSTTWRDRRTCPRMRRSRRSCARARATLRYAFLPPPRSFQVSWHHAHPDAL